MRKWKDKGDVKKLRESFSNLCNKYYLEKTI